MAIDVKNDFCLNEDFWDKDSGWKLRPEIREVFVKIKEDVILGLNEELKLAKMKFSYDKYIFTGSLTGPNWDETSDVDLHFVVDFEKSDNPALLKSFLNFFAKSFNENKFTLLGHFIEIYFQASSEPHQSPGIYNIDSDEWDKKPDCVVVETTLEHKEKAKEMFSEINDFVELWNSDLVGDPIEFLAFLRKHLEKIKAYRLKGLHSKDGMYSFENIVFKLLRRNGALKTLVTLMKNVKKKIFGTPDEDK